MFLPLSNCIRPENGSIFFNPSIIAFLESSNFDASNVAAAIAGKKQSLIIDDTYNASPEAVIAALDTLYELPAKQKIALMGQMNELGKHSRTLHEEVGKHCDPKHLDLVVTLGRDANTYLAAAAEKRGCKVMRCPSPYHAADVIRPLLKKDTVILAKGSQNGVYAEEAVKALLADHRDVKKLVRQSRQWLKVKEQQFREH